MAIQDDIDALKILQEDFRTAHNRYFSTDNEKPFDMPTEGDDLGITELNRYTKGSHNIPEASKKVAFIPTAKDYHFIIGGGHLIKGGLSYYCYMITAVRKNGLSAEIEKVQFTGGDKEAFE